MTHPAAAFIEAHNLNIDTLIEFQPDGACLGGTHEWMCNYCGDTCGCLDRMVFRCITCGIVIKDTLRASYP